MFIFGKGQIDKTNSLWLFQTSKHSYVSHCTHNANIKDMVL